MAALGERAMVERIRRLVGGDFAHVRCGIGDDAAVLARLRGTPVITCDMLLEDVDFRFRWATPADVGHKAAASNLSDLAAMGARPRALLLALALAPAASAAAVLALVRSLHRLGAAWGAPLVGGDLSRTAGPTVVAVTALGEQAGRPLLRGGGQLGDLVVVSGTLGAAAAALPLMEAGQPTPASWRARMLRPRPQLALGSLLAGWPGVRAVVDVSDGLAVDVAHLPTRPLGVCIEVTQLPLARGLARRLGLARARQLALSGGEDFELAFALAPSRFAALSAAAAAQGTQITAVGRVVAEAGVALRAGGRRLAAGAGGFDHFAASPEGSPRP